MTLDSCFILQVIGILIKSRNRLSYNRAELLSQQRSSLKADIILKRTAIAAFYDRVNYQCLLHCKDIKIILWLCLNLPERKQWKVGGLG